MQKAQKSKVAKDKRRLYFSIPFTFSAFCIFISLANAETVPPDVGPQDLALWEAGIGGGVGYLPDYPAAGQNHLKGLGFPYFIYRGRILRADREGARARFVHTPLADVEMSFAASFSSDSEDNEARRGMPDLDYLVEAGPRVTLKLSE